MDTNANMEPTLQGIIGFFLFIGILISLFYISKLLPGVREDYRAWRSSRVRDGSGSTRRDRIAWRGRPDPSHIV